jgi:hypothetical protein
MKSPSAPAARAARREGRELPLAAALAARRPGELDAVGRVEDRGESVLRRMMSNERMSTTRFW